MLEEAPGTNYQVHKDIKKYVHDAWLYMLAIFVVLLSLTYSSHTIEYLINLFFVFGLSWASTRSISKEISDGYSNKILKRRNF